jgi:hypothetical protein
VNIADLKKSKIVAVKNRALSPHQSKGESPANRLGANIMAEKHKCPARTESRKSVQ